MICFSKSKVLKRPKDTSYNLREAEDSNTLSEVATSYEEDLTMSFSPTV